MVSMLASSRRAMVSSRRCCCVLAMSGGNGGPAALFGLEEPSGFHGFAVALAELAFAENDFAVDTGCYNGRVIAVHHPRQVAIERHGLLVIGVHRVVEPGRVDDDEVGAVALAQRASREAEPLGDFGREPVHRM